MVTEEEAKKVTANQKAVLGSMLIDERCVSTVLSQVTAEDFTDASCRILFLAIRRLYNEAKTVDPVTVLAAAKEGNGDDLYYLAKTCMEETPTAANIEEYIPLLREEAKLIKARSIAFRVVDAKTVDQLRDLAAQLEAILMDAKGVRSTGMEEILARFVERQKTKVEYLTWGLPDLDKNMKIIGGKFVILGGYPSDGKTALALMMAWEQAKSLRVGFFSLETDDSTIGDRLVARRMLIDMDRIKDQALSEEDYDAVAAMSGDFIRHQLEVVDAVGMTVEDIIAYSRYRRFDVIYVDYVQLVRPTSGRTRTEEISAISMALHNGARAARITVVGLSQLTRPERAGGKFRAPRMGDLRESGQLEQDADAIILIYKENREDPFSRRVLSLEKNKEGTLGTVYLHFDGSHQIFQRHRNQSPPKSKRKEPEYKQTTFDELPGDDPDCPY